MPITQRPVTEVDFSVYTRMKIPNQLVLLCEVEESSGGELV
jgi:hypothetical protein